MRQEANQMDENKKFRRYVAIVIIVLTLGAVFVIVSGALGEDSWASVMAALLLVVMALVAVKVARRWSREMKSGFPRDDERSVAIKMRAGYLAFFISLYFMFGIGFVFAILEDTEATSVPTSEWAMIFVAVMGLIYGGVNAYLNRKGVPE